MYEIVYKDVQENEKYEKIVKKVLEQAIDAFGEKPQFDYTQEHFKRGVL